MAKRMAQSLTGVDRIGFGVVTALYKGRPVRYAVLFYTPRGETKECAIPVATSAAALDEAIAALAGLRGAFVD